MPVRGLVAHEWGTFTSIAGEDGRAVQWLPQAGPTDLPALSSASEAGSKGSLAGTVRMETPVIYFYAPRPMTVDVSVRFRQGVITEWFPRPGGTSIESRHSMPMRSHGELAWTDVRVAPGAVGRSSRSSANRIITTSPGRQMPRRCRSEPNEERFLFYRGVGRIPPPIAATVRRMDKLSSATPAAMRSATSSSSKTGRCNGLHSAAYRERSRCVQCAGT